MKLFSVTLVIFILVFLVKLSESRKREGKYPSMRVFDRYSQLRYHWMMNAKRQRMIAAANRVLRRNHTQTYKLVKENKFRGTIVDEEHYYFLPAVKQFSLICQMEKEETLSLDFRLLIPYRYMIHQCTPRMGGRWKIDEHRVNIDGESFVTAMCKNVCVKKDVNGIPFLLTRLCAYYLRLIEKYHIKKESTIESN